MIKEGVIAHLFALLAFVQLLLSLSSWFHLIALVTQEGITKQEHIPRLWEALTTLRRSDTRTVPQSISANWGWSKILKVEAVTSVPGKGPTKIIFIFCSTHAIYSSSDSKILTEQPRKQREELSSLLSELLFILFCLVFFFPL